MRFEDAHGLYRREGARVVGERVHDDPDSSHEWGLVLDLGVERRVERDFGDGRERL